MADYPAAHSMDSTWFAVDEDGNVAFFDTGEGGCLPEDARFPVGGEVGGYADDAFEVSDMLARALWARAQTDERLRALLPGDLPALVDRVAAADWYGNLPLLCALGVFVYDCPEAYAAPYERLGPVPSPLRLDDLDAETRARFAGAGLPLRFAESPRIAIGAHVLPVVAWGDFWVDLEGRGRDLDDGELLEDDELDGELSEDLEDRQSEGESLIEPLEGDALYEAVESLLTPTPAWPPA